MSKHYVAVNHESYDGDTLFGVFDSFYAARDYLESDTALSESSTAAYAVVEEWDGSAWNATYERRRGAWEERRYRETADADGVE